MASEAGFAGARSRGHRHGCTIRSPASSAMSPTSTSSVPALHTSGNWRALMKREVIRVEPLSTYLERWKAPTSAVTRSGDTIYVSGFPPFDPDTGEVVKAPIERQTELVLEQMSFVLRRQDRPWRTFSSATYIAHRSRNSQRLTRSTPVTFPRTRPPGSLSVFPLGRDLSTSR
jgi:enamine deaminase RidA (YjgF/YER057c/UK114 family)